ncbi:MAG: hypothetical protein Tp170SUR191951_90 [Prokaryotic dsDNA virus sp.]|nr:hypothetical protein [Pseudomonas sp.]MBS67383.1 hypothetical protein [Pseudomonas sp.]QDP55252.1 MAG: hypothetical protein Tp170SUR191951_90 [Prokaryotic dsDNA virus sp.]|tara:strand:+ start:702 stop:1196 length:495 start_codon:yes stop_codon:yes gene_type:complete
MTAGGIAFIADLFGLIDGDLADMMVRHAPAIAYLADSWRWWGSMGAALAIWPVGRWVMTFDPATTPYFSDTARWFLGLGLLCALMAILIAGAIIPWTVDNRIAGFNQESPLFKHGMAASWLMWGSCAWISAAGFAKRRLPILFAAVLWWWACYFALDQTAGAML